MGKDFFWRLVDISVVNSWIIFHSNNPESDVTHQELRMKLVDQLVQLLLDLQASADCPKHLLYMYNFSKYVIFMVEKFSGFLQFYFQGLPSIQKYSWVLFLRIFCNV